MKSRNSLAVPKTTVNSRRGAQEKSSFKRSSPPKRFIEEKRPKIEDEALTKIPVRRGSIVNKNGSTQSLSSSRFAGKAGAAKAKNEPSKQEPNSSNGDKRAPGVSGSRDDRKTDDRSSNDPPGSRFIEIESPPEPKKRVDDLGLIDLLKQSSGATGTSSVVNTTTTTAVQPLQIEAAAILLENDRASSSEATSGKSPTGSPSPANTDVSPEPATSPKPTNDAGSSTKTNGVTNGGQEMLAGEKRIDNRTKENGSSLTTVGSSSSVQKNPTKASSEESSGAAGNPTKKEPLGGPSSGQNSKDKAASKDSAAGLPVGAKKSVLTRNGIQDGSRGEMRLGSAKPGSRTANATNNPNNTVATERTGSGRADSSSDNVEASGKLLTGKPVESLPSLTSGHRKTDSKGSTRSIVASNNTAGDDPMRNISRNVGAANPETAVPSGNPAESEEGNKFLTNHGSETSLKSSNGLSTVSVDSVRSTDTGVSVNTVRGVSSAREKKGMHMMKNSDEIETLSGNVMHLERNGEPA